MPRLSPLYADLTGLPPIDIYQGDRDILVIDSRSFAARAKAAGSLGRYDETSGGFHVFMAATFTREAKDVFAKIEADLRTKRTQA